MAVQYGQVNVGTSATLIYTHQKYTSSPVLITNADGTNPLYLGGDANVTTSNWGHYIAKSFGEQSFSMNFGDQLWGVAAGTVAVHWIVTGA